MIKKRIGIIGCGNIVESNHLPVLKSLDNVLIAWITDKNCERASLLSKMYDVPAIQLNEVEDKIINIDICLLAIPYGYRKIYIDWCSKFGIALYVEKPFAISLNEHKTYIKLFEKERLAIGFQKRNYSFVNELKYIVDSKILGELMSVNFNQGNFIVKNGNGYLSDSRISGGGIIIESAIHVLDQILIITNAIDVKVNFLSSVYKELIDYDSFLISTISRLNDPEVLVNAEISCLRNLNNGLEFEFENAIVKCKLEEGTNFYIIPKNTIPEKNLIFKFLNQEKKLEIDLANSRGSLILFWLDFIMGIDKKCSNYTSASNSLLTTEWIEKIYSNLKTKY